MATLEAVDVATAAAPSNLTREDVLQNIVDVSEFALPFTSRIGRSSHTNAFFEWPVDRLAAAANNRVIDGSASTTPDSDPAIRMGNHSQISQKTVGTSTRLEASNNIGNESLARQTAKKVKELWRDMELMLLQNNANVADSGTGGAAGETAGLEAFLDDANVLNVTKSPQCFIDLGTGGITSIGGWTNRTGAIIPAINYTAYSAVTALTFSSIGDVLDALYQLGADNPSVLMARPAVIKRLSAFMFGSTAQIATLQRDKGEMGPAQAQASVNSLISDYGIIVDFVPNRIMGQSGDGSPDSDTVFIFDPDYISLSFMGGGIRVKELPADGLFMKTQIHSDYGLRVENPDALGGILGVNDGLAVIA
jgi:hypothetical protein